MKDKNALKIRKGVWVDEDSLRNLYDLVKRLDKDAQDYDAPYNFSAAIAYDGIREIKEFMEWEIVPFTWVKND